MMTFQFYLPSGKQGKVRLVGDDSHVIFGQEFPGEDGSVRWCVAMVQQPVLLLQTFRVKSLHMFTHSL
jgi:hypothetical protein